MTIEEARKKWCPHMRVMFQSDKSHPVANRDFLDGYKRCECIAEDCMMWRGASVHHYTTSDPGHFEIKGYCGLAGRPEGQENWPLQVLNSLVSVIDRLGVTKK
jgi:hypothetical protein